MALARRDWAAALRIVDRLTASAAKLTPGRVIARLWYLRAQALIGLGRVDQAEAVLQGARAAAREHAAAAWRHSCTWLGQDD